MDDSSLFDIAGLSEDSHAQVEDRVAVLEFELRKARETINGLRNELTAHVTTPNLSQTIDNPRKDSEFLASANIEEEDEQPEIKAHEQRTLNYLVNEYLLQRGYKLTSITFSDENSDQDFEDWESIGLNTSKPPNLLCLFRDFGRHVHHKEDQEDAQCQTTENFDERLRINAEKMEIVIAEKEELTRTIENRDTEILTSNCLNEQLKQQVAMLQDELKSKVESNGPVADVTPTLVGLEMLNSITHVEDPPKLVCSKSFLNYIRKLACPINGKGIVLLPSSSKTDDSEGLEKKLCQILSVLADSIPKIYPNVILAKRDELIPVLLVTISTHPDSGERDKLLNILFNLIKRPDDNQRQVKDINS